MIIPAFFLAVSLVMAACHTKAVEPTAPPAAEKPAQPEPTSKEAAKRPAPPDAEQEKKLKDKLQTETGGNIVQFVCLDFEDSGSYQAFAIVGEETPEEGQDTYRGTLWFVSEKDALLIGDHNSYSNLKTLVTGSKTLISTFQFYGMASTTRIYGVRNGLCFEEELSGQVSGLIQQEDGTFLAIQDAYDGSIDGTGHTWKNYWLYWNDGFHEYGGIEVPQTEFEQLDGASQVLKQIEAEKGQIISILYRENQIINVNYRTPWGDDYLNNWFVTLQYDNGKITILPSEDNRGTYLEALFPSIATYPEKLGK